MAVKLLWCLFEHVVGMLTLGVLGKALHGQFLAPGPKVQGAGGNRLSGGEGVWQPGDWELVGRKGRPMTLLHLYFSENTRFWRAGMNQL